MLWIDKMIKSFMSISVKMIQNGTTAGRQAVGLHAGRHHHHRSDATLGETAGTLSAVDQIQTVLKTVASSCSRFSSPRFPLTSIPSVSLHGVYTSSRAI